MRRSPVHVELVADSVDAAVSCGRWDGVGGDDCLVGVVGCLDLAETAEGVGRKYGAAPAEDSRKL
jgi:hypothetical protein